MGAITSKLNLTQEKADLISRRLQKAYDNTKWLSGHLLWTGVTGLIVCVLPVLFEYERECQFFEQMHQVQNAHMQAATAMQEAAVAAASGN